MREGVEEVVGGVGGNGGDRGDNGGGHEATPDAGDDAENDGRAHGAVAVPRPCQDGPRDGDEGDDCEGGGPPQGEAPEGGAPVEGNGEERGDWCRGNADDDEVARETSEGR